MSVLAGKISAFKAHTVTWCRAAHYHHGISANSGEYRSQHSECYCTSNVIMSGISECVVLHKMSMDHVYREQAHYRELQTGSLRLVKSSQIQLIFWLLAKMLQCSVEAKQAPVDNHLLCGGKQGEMEQMALVLFCHGCFFWIRNALLNAKLCGREEANSSNPAPRSSLGKGLLLCVCAPIPEWQASSAHSLMSWARGNFMTSLTHPFCPTKLSLSLTCRCWWELILLFQHITKKTVQLQFN